MRKRIADIRSAAPPGESRGGWLELDQIATVEVTSEDPRFPVDSVFTEGGQGWRAALTGEQQVRLIFDEPVSLRRIQLRFDEPLKERTQEFTLRWSAAQGGPGIEIVRQQWNFSPTGSTTELEEYTVNLDDVSTIELVVRPDINRSDAVATLASWRVG